MSQEKKEEVNTSLKKLLDLIEERLEQHNFNRKEVIKKLEEICSEKDKEIYDTETKGHKKIAEYDDEVTSIFTLHSLSTGVSVPSTWT